MSDYKSSIQRPLKLFGSSFLLTLLASSAFAASGTPHASIIAMSQKPKNGSVSITYAFLPKDGTLDVYAVTASGKREGKTLGNVALKAGDHRNVAVTLSPLPEKGTRVMAVIEKSGQPLKNSGDRPERTFTIL